MGCTERPTIWGYETVPQPCAELYMGYIDHSPDCAGLYMGHIDRPATLRGALYGVHRPLSRLRGAIYGAYRPQPCAARDMGHIDLCRRCISWSPTCPLLHSPRFGVETVCRMRDNEQIHHIFCDFPGQMCRNWRFLCNFAAFFGTWLIEITKRYARLANGNVRNFYCNARTVITVRAYSVDWLLHLHYKGTSHSLH